MSGLTLRGGEVVKVDGEERLTVTLNNGDEDVLSREVRLFSEDDMVAVSDEIVRQGKLDRADVDQNLAQIVQQERVRVLREREREGEGEEPGQPEARAEVPRYVAEFPDKDGAGEAGIRDTADDSLLSNFVLVLDEDVEVKDDFEARRDFAGRLTIKSRTVPFRIPAKDYADNERFKAALFEAAGAELVIHCGLDRLRKAVSIISSRAGGMKRRTLTTNFGWNAERTAYLYLTRPRMTPSQTSGTCA